jgi:hypothetical protein
MAVGGWNSGGLRLPANTDTEKISVFWIGRLRGVALLDRPFSTYNGAGVGRWDFFQVTGPNELAFQCLRATTHGVWSVIDATSGYGWGNSAEQKPFAVTYDGTSTANDPVFYAGTRIETAVNERTAPAGAITATPNDWTIGNRQDAMASRQAELTMSLFLQWNRVLSHDEIIELNRNPWQVFKR